MVKMRCRMPPFLDSRYRVGLELSLIGVWGETGIRREAIGQVLSDCI